VENELSTLDSSAAPTPPPVQEPSTSVKAEPRRAERTAVRSNVRTNDAPDVRTEARTKVRHSFDVYQDQLLSLAEIQAAVYRRTGKKPKAGDLVQEAIDAYIESHRERTDERSSVRTAKRSNGR
jgi:hypothetical protein